MTDTARGEPGQPSAGLAHAEFDALVLATQQEIDDTPATAAGPAVPGFATGDDVVDNDVRRAAAVLPSRPLSAVLNERRSAHAMTAFALHELVALLARTYRVQDVHYAVANDPAEAAERAAWTSRPVPSAGGRHPFELLVYVAGVNGLDAGRYVFDPHRVGLSSLAPAWVHYAREVEEAALRASHADTYAPATILLIANVDRVAARYSAPLTLLLRDAGVLLQTLHLVATDLGLASRILGSAGHIARDIDTGHLVVDCGALIVGKR